MSGEVGTGDLEFTRHGEVLGPWKDGESGGVGEM